VSLEDATNVCPTHRCKGLERRFTTDPQLRGGRRQIGVGGSAIIKRMFDVLVYLYENYWRPDACPEPALLKRKLSALGFERDEIQEALAWLDGLTTCHALGSKLLSSDSVRIYTDRERFMLGDDSLAFLGFLVSAGVLSAALRELVIDRAVAATETVPIPLEDMKIIVLMVFWSLGQEPDALILDELFVDPEDRLVH
jgi:Smg protein